jgi:hypothetical protein
MKNLLPTNTSTQLNLDTKETNKTESNSMKTELRDFLTSLNSTSEKKPTQQSNANTIGFANEVNEFSSY